LQSIGKQIQNGWQGARSESTYFCIVIFKQFNGIKNMWIEIFRSGEHTSSNGNTQSYSAQDLSEIANKYNNKLKEDPAYKAPLVKGHPSDDAPAYGWIEMLTRKGDKLLAKVKDISSDIISQVRDGSFKKVSISLHNDKMLRHVGLLGSATPAVQGLKPIEFEEQKEEIEDENTLTSEFNEYDDIQSNLENSEKEIEKLKSEIEELKKLHQANEINNFCENFAKENNMNQEQKELTQDMINSALILDLNFAENLKESLSKLFKKEKKEFDFSEYAVNKSNFTHKENNFTKGNISPERLALHHKIEEIMIAGNLGYEDALKIAMG
jgi:hypothetical protein